MSRLPQLPTISGAKAPALLSSTPPTTHTILGAAPPHRRHPLPLPEAVPRRPLRAVSVPSTPAPRSDASDLAYCCCYSVAPSPPPSALVARLDGLRCGNHHLLLLSATGCAVAISASWLFLSMIPSLLACKRAAESLEKLSDVTRGELPETMAAVRFAATEISDLTADLGDVGQELTKGVRSSTSAVRAAESQVHQLAGTASQESAQRPASLKRGMQGSLLARTARELREEIGNSQTFFGAAFSIFRFATWALKFRSEHRN